MMTMGDGFLGDVGPFSFYNVMRAMTLLYAIGLVVAWLTFARAH
jgi:hypothetical protein